MDDCTVPILLLPRHVRPNPSDLPLLKGIQTLLNKLYSATHCAHPETFGSRHVRLTEPSKLENATFTTVLVRILATQANANRRLCKVIATGSVKNRKTPIRRAWPMPTQETRYKMYGEAIGSLNTRNKLCKINNIAVVYTIEYYT